MSPTPQPHTLSDDASRLLHYLRLCSAHGPHEAISQADLAHHLHLSPRTIRLLTRQILDIASIDIDTVGGRVPIARTETPAGVFLSDDPDELAAYDASLRSRAIENFRRRKSVRAVARQLTDRRAQRRRQTDDGQLLLHEVLA